MQYKDQELKEERAGRQEGGIMINEGNLSARLRRLWQRQGRLTWRCRKREPIANENEDDDVDIVKGNAGMECIEY